MIAKGSFIDAVLLLMPGLLAAIGFYAMSASRIVGLDKNVAATFLMFIPWTALGLTVAKCGLDTWILSRGSEWRGRSFPLGRIGLFRMLPAAAVSTVALTLVFSPVAGVAGGVSILADALALVVASEMSAQGRVRQAAFAHFLRHPLFFVLLVAVVDSRARAGVGIYLAFMASSLARLGYLLLLRPRDRVDSYSGPRGTQLAWQQVLNYGLFKNDQLAFLGVTSDVSVTRQVLVYLARFPELVSAAVGSLGPLLYPAVHSKSDMNVPGNRRMLLVCLAIGLAVLGAAGAVFRAIAPAELFIPWAAVLAVVVHAALIFPVNLRTYQLFRGGEERTLIAALVKANGAGIAFALAILWLVPGAPSMLLWTVAVQQVVFLAAVAHYGQ